MVGVIGSAQAFIITNPHAREAGLVDVKAARFSDTHTAEKLVIPVTRR